MPRRYGIHCGSAAPAGCSLDSSFHTYHCSTALSFATKPATMITRHPIAMTSQVVRRLFFLVILLNPGTQIAGNTPPLSRASDPPCSTRFP